MIIYSVKGLMLHLLIKLSILRLKGINSWNVPLDPIIVEAADKKQFPLYQTFFLLRLLFFCLWESLISEQCLPSIILSSLVVPQKMFAPFASRSCPFSKTILVLEVGKKDRNYSHVFIQGHYLQFHTSKDMSFTSVSVPQSHLDNLEIRIPEYSMTGFDLRQGGGNRFMFEPIYMQFD